MPRSLDQASEILRRLGLETQRFAGHRMLEAEQPGMQRLAVESASTSERGPVRAAGRFGQEALAIILIADQRMAERRHMDADLVRAAGFEAQIDQAGDRRAAAGPKLSATV